MTAATAIQPFSKIILGSLRLYKQGLIKILPLCVIYFLLLFLAHMGETLPFVPPAVHTALPILMTLISPLILAALVFSLDEFLHDKPICYKRALGLVCRKIHILVICFVIYTLAIIIGGFLLVIPGVFIMVSALYFYNIVMLENGGIWGSLKGSLLLVWGHWFRTAAVFFSAMFIYIICSVLIASLLAGLTFVLQWVLIHLGVDQLRAAQMTNNIAMVGILFGPAILVPLPACFMVMQFRDLQLRKKADALEAAAANDEATLSE